jgi:nicotinamidase-related amidase
VPKTALIVVDMLNAYEHPDAEKLTRSVENVLPTIAELVEESDFTVYVNDNMGADVSPARDPG